jgi:hypothetical protein
MHSPAMKRLLHRRLTRWDYEVRWYVASSEDRPADGLERLAKALGR